MKNEAVPSSASSKTPARLHAILLWLWHWGPLLLWMTLIFGFSTDAGSTRRTSRFIGPFLRWLVPDISEEAIQGVQLVVRKTAHMVEYAILAFLAWRAKRSSMTRDRRLWRRSDATFAIAIAILFAITDEWHQSFVPSRQGQLTDVLFDSAGAVFAMLALWGWGRHRRHW